jgi:hypothetical protein
VSNGAFSDWMLTDDWVDYRQQRNLRRLGDELSTLNSSLYEQRAESSRLRSQLARVQGSLEERITALSRAFDAFVELSDIRVVLGMFDAPALLRHRSRQLLAGIGDPSYVPPAVLLPPGADVANYWLAPAVRALGVLLDGGDAAADLAAAEALEPVKTATLLAAATALTGRTELAVAWLAKALPEVTPARPVTRAERVLWQAAVHGLFGAGGVALIEERLTTLVRRLDPAGSTKLDDALHTTVVARAASKTGVLLFASYPEVDAALTAGRRLAGLRALCEPAPAVEATAKARPSTDPSGGALDHGPAALAQLVRRLVDEGTEEERPLLRRAEELQALIETRAARVQPPWDEPVAPPEELLAADAGNRHDPECGALARRVVAARLLAIADGLAAAAAVDPPARVTAEQRTGKIRVTAAGPDPGDIAAARARVEREYPPVKVPDAGIWALLAAGVALAVLGLFLPTPWLVLCLLGGVGLLIGGAARFTNVRGRRATQDELRTRAGNEVQRKAEQSGRDYLAGVETLRTVGRDAVADHEAVKAALKV